MKKDNNQYVATIVQKRDLGDDCFLIYFDHLSVGEMDEETLLFKDKDGNTFIPISNTFKLTSPETPLMYDEIVMLKDMREIAKENNTTLKSILADYEDMAKKTVHVISKGKNGTLYKKTVTADEISEELQEDPLPLQNPSGKEITIDDLEELMIDINEGKYTEDELQSILESLKATGEDINSVIEFVEANQKEKETNEEEVEHHFNVKEVFNEVVKTLIGQDEACLRTITEIARKELDNREKRQGILLTGKSGVGKTELMRLIEKYTSIPVHRIDSSELTVPGGYPYGKTIEEELWSLYEKCGKNKKSAEKAILFFDGIDSWLSREEECNPDIMRIPLNVMDGKTYHACKDITNPRKTVDINTSNMTVVLGGTYSNKNDFGFLQKKNGKDILNKTMRDFVEKGQMPKNYMGRVSIIKLNDLDVESLKRILNESNESPTKVQEEVFKKLGVKITFTDGYIEEAANTVMKKEIGAHSLSNTINESTWKALYEVESNPEVYEEVIIDRESLYDEDAYQLIKKRSN